MGEDVRQDASRQDASGRHGFFRRAANYARLAFWPRRKLLRLAYPLQAVVLACYVPGLLAAGSLSALFFASMALGCVGMALALNLEDVKKYRAAHHPKLADPGFVTYLDDRFAGGTRKPYGFIEHIGTFVGYTMSAAAISGAAAGLLPGFLPLGIVGLLGSVFGHVEMMLDDAKLKRAYHGEKRLKDRFRFKTGVALALPKTQPAAKADAQPSPTSPQAKAARAAKNNLG